MVIPEKVKLVGLTALLGGVGVLVYKSATQSDRLQEAISHIRCAQDSIAASKQMIEVAKNDIFVVRGELKSLQAMAGQAQINLEALRQERQQLVSSIKESVTTSREVLARQKVLVLEFEKQKKEEEKKVENISDLITYPLNPKN
jgi:predicted RNase H-like nuclease (RuvC/YqgF family)